MATVRFSNTAQKDFQKDFDYLCRCRGRWQVWSDLVHLMAYSISNVFDEVHREKRESEYCKIAAQHNQTEFEAIVRLFSTTVLALEENPDQDFLGDIYMKLDLGNSHAGQFFTPYHVSKMMALMNVGYVENELSGKGFVSVNDCCVGGGAMLIGFANACIEKNINFQKHVLFVGQDIDHTVGMMAYIQLSLLGCAGYIVIGNSLTEPLEGDPLFAPMDRETFITPMYCSTIWNTRRAIRVLKATSDKTEHAEQIEIEPAQEPTVITDTAPVQLTIFDMEVRHEK